MPAAPTCRNCSTPLQPGYILDHNHASYYAASWSPGQAKPSFWTGGIKRPRQLLPIIVYRCPTCGLLESYAPAEDPNAT